MVFNVCLHSRSFPLRADWRKSDSSVDGESQGNWNLNSRGVVAIACVAATSFPGFSPTRPTERERVGENPGNEVGMAGV